jgi:F-type H+-transporting ATPase subunit alpha
MALSLYAVDNGYMDDLPLNKIGAFEAGLHDHFANTQGELMTKIVDTGDWNKDIEGAFKKGISEFKSTGTW